MIHKYRNSICFKCLFQIVSIYIHITDYDTNLTITVSFFSYQFPDLFCYSHCFFSRISRHMNSKIFHFFFICSCSISENIPLQKCQLFIFLKTLYRISIQADRFLYCNVFFPRQTDQCCHHLLAQSKQLIWMSVRIWILPLIHDNRYPYILTIFHKLQNQPVLHRCKACKSIQYHCAVL